jgi:signal recognition particle subunit SRP54
MVCGDTFRAGALDQLKQNAVKLRVPFYGSHTVADPVQICADGVRKFRKDKYELILVDTSGRHRQEASLLEEMQEISSATHPNLTVMVVDATQGQAIGDQASAFASSVEVGGVIVTKLDGHAKGGGAMSAVAASGAPILFLGVGEHFDDLEPFNAQSFVSKLLGFADMRGLMQAINDVSTGQSGDPNQKPAIVKSMESGQFTLRDLYQQYQNMLNVGPLSRFAGGFAGMMPGMNDPGLQQRQLRRFMVMMDSMTSDELDGKVDLHKKFDDGVDSRIRRIARGSGCHPEEVRLLLLSHRQMEGFVKKVGKSGVASRQNQIKQQQFIAQARKNPNLIQQRVNQMDPKTLQQLGGRDAVIAMMQQQVNQGGGAGGNGMDDMVPPPPGGFGGMSGFPGMPPGMDMEQLMKMAQAMGMGPGAPMAGGPGMGGFPGSFTGK